VALGSIIGAGWRHQAERSRQLANRPNLWGGIVGDPSAKKSPAWGAALKPLDRLIATALEAHTAAQADYETEKVVFDAHKDAIERRIKEAAKKPSKGDPASIAKELLASKRRNPDVAPLQDQRQHGGEVGRVAARKPSGAAGAAG
jgi:hypothetical protein